MYKIVGKHISTHTVIILEYTLQKRKCTMKKSFTYIQCLFVVYLNMPRKTSKQEYALKISILEVKLIFDPVCPSVGQSFLKGPQVSIPCSYLSICPNINY